MKKCFISFTALFLALSTMPTFAMYRNDCEALVRNCLTVRSSSTYNNCRETDAQLPGIDADPMVKEYVTKYRAIVDSDKTDEQRRSEKDNLTNQYKQTLIDKYCKDYTYYFPGTTPSAPVNTTVANTLSPIEKKEEKTVVSAPSVKLTTDKTVEEASKEAKRIKTEAQNLKIGGTLTLPTGTISTYQQVKSAISEWNKKCHDIVIAAGGAKEHIDPQGSNDKIQKQSCFIETCDETKGYKKEPIAKMSCQKTSEQKKLEKEYQVKDDGSAKVVSDIKAASENIAIGSYITIPNTLKDHDKIDTEHSIWEQKCENINNDEVGSATIKEETVGKNIKYTCIIKTCKQQGYEPTNDGKSCKKTAEQKKADKKEAKEQSNIEKQYEKDIDELIKAHESVVQKFVKECNAKGGDMENGKCSK